MKTFIFLFIFFLFSFTVGKGQSNIYHPIPDTNAYWNEYIYSTDFNHPQPYLNSDYRTLFFSNDTVINSITYHKVLKSGFTNTYPNTNTYYSNIYCGALRQDLVQKKVYFIPLNSSEQLLYNFNLTIGDTLPNYPIQPYYNLIFKIDSVVVGNFSHKRFLLKVYYNSSNIDTSIAIIEGVGSTAGLFNPFVFGEGTNKLHCFGNYNQNYPVNSNCSYITNINKIDIKHNITIYPNPAASSFIIETNLMITQFLEIYDITGKIVLSKMINDKTTIDVNSLANGIYNLRFTSDEAVVNRRLIIAK